VIGRSDEARPADAGQLVRGVRRPAKKQRVVYRIQPPANRVRRALARLSRDKWLAPTECIDLAQRLAACCSANSSWTADAAVPDACLVIGMLRGMPPAFPWDHDYPKFMAALRGLKPQQSAKAELLILKLQLERNSRWKQLN